MKATLRDLIWLLVPAVIACVGVAWMYGAVDYYEQQTGRHFYGLAALHYSIPDWGMTYHRGGREIERWTVDVPMVAILGALALTLGITFWRERRRHALVWFLACALWYGLVGVAFLAVVAWIDLNVTGIFI